MVSWPVTNDGWRIGLPEDHVDYSEKQRRSALRKEKLAFGSLMSAPRAELNDHQTRRVEFALTRSAARLQQAKQHDTETRKEFKLTERVPLRVLTKGQT